MKKQGFSVIDMDLNDGCGSSSHYVFMGCKTTTNPKEAITGIAFYAGSNPPESYEDNGVKFYLLGGSKEPNPGENKPVDLNTDAGGKYIYTYVTRDVTHYYTPVTAIEIYNSDDDSEVCGTRYYSQDGKFMYVNCHEMVSSDSGTYDVNSGARGSTEVYVKTYHIKKRISNNIWVRSGDGSSDSEVGVYVTDGSEYSGASNYDMHKIGYTTYLGDSELVLAGWREDDVPDAPTITELPALSVSNCEKQLRSVYKSNVTLQLDYGRLGLPEYRSQPQCIIAASDGTLKKQTLSFELPTEDPLSAKKCKIQSWLVVNSAETGGSGQTLTASENVNLRAYYKEHNYEDGVCKNCGKTLYAASAIGGGSVTAVVIFAVVAVAAAAAVIVIKKKKR